MITITNQPARRTSVLAHSKRLADFCPTDTHLRRSRWVDFHKHASSIFRFVREHKQKVRPSGVVNRLRQYSARESLNIQIFNRNQSVLVNDLSRLLMLKVASLIANVIVKPLKQKHGLAATVRSFFPARNASLQAPQFALSGSEPTRILNPFASAQRCKGTQAHINAYRIGAERQRLNVNLDGEQGEPAARLTLDRERLDRTFRRPVQFNSHIADLRQPKFIALQRMANLTERHAVVAPRRTESRVARLLAVLNTTKESIKCKMNALKDVLQYVSVDFCYVLAERFDLRKLKSLIEIRNAFSLDDPSIAPLLQSGIVEFATDRKLVTEGLFLPFSWVDAIAKGFDHASPILPYQQEQERKWD